VQQIADDQLERFIDGQAIEKAADSLREMLEATGTIRAEFDAFTPWLTDFVEASVLRITGALPPQTLWAGLIEQSLSDIRDRWNLVLLCHPTLVVHLKTAVSATPALREVIRDVHPDRTLGLEDCLIQSGQGITDISLSTQLGALVKALEKFPADSPDADSAGHAADALDPQVVEAEDIPQEVAVPPLMPNALADADKTARAPAPEPVPDDPVAENLPSDGLPSSTALLVAKMRASAIDTQDGAD